MTELLFGVLLQGLKLWNTKESNKYLDEVVRLQSDWLKEYSKPRSKISHADLDEIEIKLAIIAKSFAANYKAK